MPPAPTVRRMFIFNRPFLAVAAGLGVALLFVGLDRVRQPPATPDSARVANTTPLTCAAPGACGIVRAGS